MDNAPPGGQRKTRSHGEDIAGEWRRYECRRSEVETPLHEATAEWHRKVVQLLLENGAHVNAETKLGETPVHKAAIWGRQEVVQLLLERGADATEEDCNGK